MHRRLAHTHVTHTRLIVSNETEIALQIGDAEKLRLESSIGKCHIHYTARTCEHVHCNAPADTDDVDEQQMSKRPTAIHAAALVYHLPLESTGLQVNLPHVQSKSAIAGYNVPAQLVSSVATVSVSATNKAKQHLLYDRACPAHCHHAPSAMYTGEVTSAQLWRQLQQLHPSARMRKTMKQKPSCSSVVRRVMHQFIAILRMHADCNQPSMNNVSTACSN